MTDKPVAQVGGKKHVLVLQKNHQSASTDGSKIVRLQSTGKGLPSGITVTKAVVAKPVTMNPTQMATMNTPKVILGQAKNGNASYPPSISQSHTVSNGQSSSVAKPPQISTSHLSSMLKPTMQQQHQAPLFQSYKSLLQGATGNLTNQPYVTMDAVDLNPQTVHVFQGNRKRCNCTKSQCLKLYCECFASSEFCSGCNCTNCFNDIQHEEHRNKAVKQCLDRNPLAFHPKIGKDTGGIRQHQKGCNCKRSGCLKNYCECYEAKILCTNHCKCVGCRNWEGGLLACGQSADACAVSSIMNPSAFNATLDTLEPSLRATSPSQPNPRYRFHAGARTLNRLRASEQSAKPVVQMPHEAVTPVVVEAVTSCLVNVAHKAAAANASSEQMEALVLQEFGRCLTDVIQTSYSHASASKQ